MRFSGQEYWSGGLVVIITVIVITTFGAEGGKGQGLLGRDERSHSEGGEGSARDRWSL